MVTLFLAGDVMIGRGIDQVMAHSVDPVLYEQYIHDARDYVALAERTNGPIPKPVTADYVWGDALEAIDEAGADYRIVNLETAITTSPTPWPGKPIHYRAHPYNVGVLQAARLDCCALANNHVLDLGETGLLETLDSLHGAGLATAGAGRSLADASAPVLLDGSDRKPGGRVIVVAFASTSSGTPAEWSGGRDRPGLLVVDGWSTDICRQIGDRLAGMRRSGDVVVASVHWGSNWGYDVPRGQRGLAHALVDVAGVDVVFGHSSHHARPVELYRDRLILYGCGDFITDYEGISGHEEFRNDLVLAWFVEIDEQSGKTASVTMAPFQSRRFRLERASVEDADWLAATLDRQSRPFGVRVVRLDTSVGRFSRLQIGNDELSPAPD
jgi:poly-gamma-glutamate capsule biosynthesis protein CapA/YwtB (metallophosphatase superfamily)